MLPQALNDAAAQPGAAARGEPGQPVPSGLGAGGGAQQRPRAGGVRHGAVRPHACAVPGADRAMGLFINTLPLRLDLDGTGVEASVRTTHARLAELLAHEHASLALAQRCSGVAAPAPLFSALLNYRHNTPAAMSGSAPNDVLAGVEWLGGEERTNYPLTLVGGGFWRGARSDGAGGGGRSLRIGSAATCSARSSSWLRHWSRPPTGRCETLDILPAAERAYLLEELNRTAAPYPAERCIHELFEAAGAPGAGGGGGGLRGRAR